MERIKKTYINIKNLDLKYPLFSSKGFSLRKKLINFIHSENLDLKSVHALKNINIEMNDGDRVGLVGPNGSGKTSLLKIIAGIYPPTIGNVSISHEPYTLIDVSMGMNLDANGLENIYLMSYLRNIDVNKIDNNLDKIIEFSGIGDAINREVRTYSSGMKIRLATSISLFLETDIFLIDEFFGAGDKDFIQKTKNALIKKIEKTGILVIATHDEKIIDTYCNRKVKLVNGKIIEDNYI